jgi:hypothetical protein
VATEGDWASYMSAVVDLAPPSRPPVRLVPAAPGATGAWPDDVASPVVVVTAWNPDSVRLQPDVNAARHRLLVRDLGTRGLAWWAATGRDLDGGHHESGVAVPGLAEPDGLALGRRHGQAAVYVWTPGAWEVVACDGSRRVTLGWGLTTPPHDPPN